MLGCPGCFWPSSTVYVVVSGPVGEELSEDLFESELSPPACFGPLLLSGEVLRLRLLSKEMRPCYLVFAGNILDIGDLCCDWFMKPKLRWEMFLLPRLCLVVLQPLSGDIIELYSAGVLKF